VRLDRWLRFVRQVGRRGDLAQRGSIAVLALGERFLAPVLVEAATVWSAGRALAVGAALSAVFALRGFIQSAHLARTEAGLYVRVVDSVLRQDVLMRSVLPDEEARAALFEGAHGVASLLAEGLPNLCANLVAATVFAVVVALTQPPRIVVVAALSGSAGVLLLVASRRAFEAAQAAESSAWIELADGVGDAFDGRLEIVAGGSADAYSAIFAKIVSAWSKATRRAAHVARLAGRLPLLALAVSVGVSVVLDALLRGEPAGRTLGQAALLASMSPAFVGIAQGFQEIARSDRRVQQMAALVTGQPSLATRGTQPPGDVRSVDLRAVHFAYERGGRRHDALRGVSFTWRAGELLALAGPNGSGKSTCLRVLLALGRPSAGDVLVNGVPLERIDVDQWRRSITFLPQRPYFPQRVTVRHCLRFVDSDVTETVMTEAAERVGLARALRREAGSLDVRVDELSVGQRQRVGLARLLCRRAPLVMLDEPDANLDFAGVELVTDLVRELARDAMVIVVAHSPRLLAAADRVLTLSLGQISSESTQASSGRKS
jgi:ATP-binding cassette subfamily C protein CydCD